MKVDSMPKRGRSTLTGKRFFLIDGSGAILTAFFSGIMLTQWEAYFGMPRKVLIPLALLALLFAAYSVSCYFFAGKNWPRFLKIIALSNLAYCCISIGLIIFYRDLLTSLGWTYFILEILVVVLLVYFELRATSEAERRTASI